MLISFSYSLRLMTQGAVFWLNYSVIALKSVILSKVSLDSMFAIS